MSQQTSDDNLLMDADFESQTSSNGSTGDSDTTIEYSSSGKNELRFRIKKWSAIAMWSYELTVDNCAICRNHIMDKCIECQTVQEMTNNEENCSISWGKCSHVFHTHCISRWLNTRKVCPLDNRNWELKSYGN